MKRLSWLVVILVCTAHSTRAQQGLQAYVVTGTGAQARIVLTGSAIVFHQLTWNVTGTVSSCTVALDTSTDGVSWSAGNAITGQTCTSNGQSALSTSAVFNFVRVNTTAFSGTGSVVVTWAGYVATPGGLPSGCTSPGTGAITCTNNVLGANLPPALPTTPNGVSFIDTSTPAGGIAVAPAWSWPGVPGRSNAGATDAIVYTDRGAGVLETNGGAVAVSLPQAGIGNFANNFDFFLKCATTTVCTITPTVSQIAGNNGTLGATLVMPASSTAYCYSLDSANYQCGVISSSSAGTVTTTGSPLSTYCAVFSGAATITGVAGCTEDASGNVTENSLTTLTINAPAAQNINLRAGAAAEVQVDNSVNGANALSIKGGNFTVRTSGGSQDFQLNAAAGTINQYNGINTTGNGLAAENATPIDLTAQTAAITPTTVYAAPATGFYRVCFSADITTAGTTSVLGGAAGFAVVYTSPTDSVVKTTTLDPGTTSSGNTTGTAVDGCKTVYAKTGTNIQYSFGYTSTGTAMVFEIHVREESF